MSSPSDSMRFRGDTLLRAAEPLVVRHQQELVVTRRREPEVVLSAAGELRYAPAQDLRMPSNHGGGGTGGGHVIHADGELHFPAVSPPPVSAPQPAGRSGGPARGGGGGGGGEGGAEGVEGVGCAAAASAPVFVVCGAVPPVEQELKDEWVIIEQGRWESS